MPIIMNLEFSLADSFLNIYPNYNYWTFKDLIIEWDFKFFLQLRPAALLKREFLFYVLSIFFLNQHSKSVISMVMNKIGKKYIELWSLQIYTFLNKSMMKKKSWSLVNDTFDNYAC